eukprot:s806_g13.t1
MLGEGSWELVEREQPAWSKTMVPEGVKRVIFLQPPVAEYMVRRVSAKWHHSRRYVLEVDGLVDDVDEDDGCRLECRERHRGQGVASILNEDAFAGLGLALAILRNEALMPDEAMTSRNQQQRFVDARLPDAEAEPEDFVNCETKTLGDFPDKWAEKPRTETGISTDAGQGGAANVATADDDVVELPRKPIGPRSKFVAFMAQRFETSRKRQEEVMKEEEEKPVIPAGMGFGGQLECGYQSCILAAGTNASDYYEFNNSRDYLTCRYEVAWAFGLNYQGEEILLKQPSNSNWKQHEAVMESCFQTIFWSLCFRHA